MSHVSERTLHRCFNQWLVSWSLLSVTVTEGIPVQTQVPGTESTGAPGSQAGLYRKQSDLEELSEVAPRSKT